LLLSRFFIILLLLGVSFSAEAGLPFLSETVSWDEDVLQADGRLLLVHRTATYGPDIWGRSGQGSLKEQTIRFIHNGQKIEWENSDLWPIVYMPDILDVIDGMPVLVMPVHRWGPCEKYGFPQEGLVAFGYRNGRWDRIALSDLPKELRVNLLRSTHAIQYWDRYKDKRITPSIKHDLEQSGWGSTKQDQSISEASKFFAGTVDSCARIRPLPNPLLEVLKQQNAEAETRAQALVATITSSSNSLEKISPDDFRKTKRGTAVTGSLAENCKDVVEQVEGLRQYGDGGSWNLVGYTLVLRNGSRVPIQQPNIKFAQAPDSLESVTCDEKSIYTVKRQSKDQLIIHRFSYSGALIGALHITLPEVAEGTWPMIWEVMVSNGQLGISLADYSYTATANQGGLVKQRLNYTVQLPR
jgi:hypothetical protein